MKLVFLHGRSQEGKDPHALRQRWVDALHLGLERTGLDLAIDDSDIVFPFYGDALSDATSPAPDALGLVRFPWRERTHILHCDLLEECLDRAGITEAAVDDAQAPIPEPEGLADRISSSLTNQWVQRGLSLFDRYFPDASARSLEATVADVSRYLEDVDVQDHIERGVAHAFASCGDEDTVVVGHSLGSIIAYRVLREGGLVHCPVKALITIGSPLGISAVRRALEPIGHPPLVQRWFNGYDDRDVVALNPLDEQHFPVSPSISNFSQIVNHSENHHGIDGYLGSGVVGRWIAEAITR